LSTVYSKLMEIWREKTTASEGAQIALIRKSTYQCEIYFYRFLRPLDLTVFTVETPLNAIINYLELASENTIDHKTRRTLSKALEASNSVISTVNNLLKLTDTEDGSNHPKSETFNLRLTGKSSTFFLLKLNIDIQ
jgi:hypothetical protein